MNEESEKIKILAAFDLETTGLNPHLHDIIEIAIVPLNADFTRSDIPVFCVRIKAEHPENADSESLKISGLNPHEGDSIAEVASAISVWMNENRIGLIHPVAHNLQFDLGFFQTKFPSLSHIFSGHGRDSMRLAISINDLALAQTGKKLFESVSLKKLKSHFGMTEPVQHRASADALDAAKLYRWLMTKLIINP